MTRRNLFKKVAAITVGVVAVARTPRSYVRRCLICGHWTGEHPDSPFALCVRHTPYVWRDPPKAAR